MAENAPSPVERQRQRSSRAWNNRSAWDSIYQEAYDLVLPNRQPGGLGKPKAPTQMIFDMTGPNSAMHCAGQIQRQVFPIATPFQLECGPLVSYRLDRSELTRWNHHLATIAAGVYPFFKTGDFDTAVHEMCTDLTIGTGFLLPLKGPSIEEPLRFVCVPQSECAIGQDAFSRVNFVSWKRENLGREAILEAWPRGNFSSEFRELAKSKPYDEIVVYQDFFRLPDGRWRFVAYLEKDGGFIVEETYRTQPIAAARFYRWPGEAYGRGPVLFALPTIKTANKAQELTLKAAAIQMLGIWGYRSGGTFNPDTVNLGPGTFWPMQSTGGVLGPDVQRLDPAQANLQVSRLVLGNQQQQIREALLDTRIADDGGTPPSASEVAARVQQNANVHIGAYGRLNRETIAVIVPRSMEILAEWQLLPGLMNFNELLLSMHINSPMAAALNADQLSAMVNYYELAMGIAPEDVGEHVHPGRILEHARKALMVPADVTPTEDEIAAWRARKAQQAMMATAGAMAERAAPQLAQGMLQEAA